MSKIQKALNALKDSRERQSQGNPGSGGDELLPEGKSRTNRLRKRNGSSGNSESKLRRPFDDSYETTPKHSIVLDSNDLKKAGLLPADEDQEIIAQQFRRIKRPVLKAAFEVDLPTGDNANVVMMASAMPGAGKSFCAFNLVQSIAIERDVGAVLVDADVLKPGISRSLGLQDHVGLIDYLLDPTIDFADILVATNLNDVVVIPAGRKHPQATELLASRRMQDLVALLATQYQSRAVVFDTPPLLLTNEAQVLATNMGQIVLVIEARVSSQESVMRALGMLDREKPINAILNKSRNAAGDGYQSDDYGYYPYPKWSDINGPDA